MISNWITSFLINVVASILSDAQKLKYVLYTKQQLAQSQHICGNFIVYIVHMYNTCCSCKTHIPTHTNIPITSLFFNYFKILSPSNYNIQYIANHTCSIARRVISTAHKITFTIPSLNLQSPFTFMASCIPSFHHSHWFSQFSPSRPSWFLFIQSDYHAHTRREFSNVCHFLRNPAESNTSRQPTRQSELSEYATIIGVTLLYLTRVKIWTIESSAPSRRTYCQQPRCATMCCISWYCFVFI